MAKKKTKVTAKDLKKMDKFLKRKRKKAKNTEPKSIEDEEELDEDPFRPDRPVPMA